MIRSWRTAFASMDAYFGFVQLSTWCALPPSSLPQMRHAQMSALSLPRVGYATNADHGMGCNIHPAQKMFAGERLATSALALVNGLQRSWRSPTYKDAHYPSSQLLHTSASMAIAHERSDASTPPSSSSSSSSSSITSSSVVLRVSLTDVSTAGIQTVYPPNWRSPGYGSGAADVTVDCSGIFPINATLNGSMADMCAWAALQLDGVGWLNASVSVDPSDGQALLLTATLPDTALEHDEVRIVASSYGWGPIPMLSAYDVQTGLPVLPWNATLAHPIRIRVPQRRPHIAASDQTRSPGRRAKLRKAYR
jgi:hypothetical protein